jgi:hypothetical protein
MAPPVAVLFHRPQHALVGLLDEPALLLGARPFHPLIRPQGVTAPRHLRAGRLQRGFHNADDDGRKQALIVATGSFLEV